MGAAGKVAAARKPSFGTRAWRTLRLAVLWARRGSAAHSLRLLSTLRRHGLGGGGHSRGDRLRYGEREYSIEETPAFRFRTPSARVLRLIPCFAPETPGLYGDDDRYFFRAARERESASAAEEKDDDAGSCSYYRYADPNGCYGDDEEEDESCCGVGDDEQLLELAMAEARRASTTGAGAEGDAAVDAKAEEFIARFHAQMKLQRQISWLQYNEMMERSIS